MTIQTIIRDNDGKTLRLRTEAWQHDPYAVYMPVSRKQFARLLRFGGEQTLRWGSYNARVYPIVAAPGRCPHC